MSGIIVGSQEVEEQAEERGAVEGMPLGWVRTNCWDRRNCFGKYGACIPHGYRCWHGAVRAAPVGAIWHGSQEVKEQAEERVWGVMADGV